MPFPKQLPALPAGETQQFTSATRRIRLVQDLQRRWVPQIIASGVFSNYESWSAVLSTIAAADPTDAAQSRALVALFTRMGEPRIPNPDAPSPDNSDYAVDVADARTFHWGETGFVLGLAVGMMLGPHAFGPAEKGGAR